MSANEGGSLLMSQHPLPVFDDTSWTWKNEKFSLLKYQYWNMVTFVFLLLKILSTVEITVLCRDRRRPVFILFNTVLLASLDYLFISLSVPKRSMTDLNRSTV